MLPVGRGLRGQVAHLGTTAVGDVDLRDLDAAVDLVLSRRGYWGLAGDADLSCTLPADPGDLHVDVCRARGHVVPLSTKVRIGL